MTIVARRIELMGRQPAIDPRPGSVVFKVSFEVTTDAGDFQLAITVNTPGGMDDVMGLARQELVGIFNALKSDAEHGDLGHQPGTLSVSMLPK